MLDRLSSKLRRIDKTMAAYILAALAVVGMESRVRAAATGLGGAQRGQLGQGTVIAALVVVITVSLGVIVVDQFDQSLGTANSSSLSTAQNDVLQGFADMTSLIGPLLLVAIAVVIIGLVQRIRQ